jgi:hypothetical protein
MIMYIDAGGIEVGGGQSQSDSRWGLGKYTDI